MIWIHFENKRWFGIIIKCRRVKKQPSTIFGVHMFENLSKLSHHPSCFWFAEKKKNWNSPTVSLCKTISYLRVVLTKLLSCFFQKYRMGESEDHLMLFDLVMKMLSYDPNERISLDEALRHPFFDSVLPHHRLDIHRWFLTLALLWDL